MAMVTPDEINLTLYRIVTGDTREFLTKFAATQSALETFSAQLNPMVASIAQALADALQEAENTRQQAINETTAIKDAAQQAAGTASTKAGEAASSAAAAQQARDEAQQIAVGNVAVTDLQPGTLAFEKDYVSVDAQGALVKRNLTADVSEQLNSGEESFSASTYELAGGDPGTTTLDLAEQQVFELTNPTSLAIDFINLPAAGKGKPIIVRIDGPGSVTFSFPGFTIDWEGGGAENNPPDVGEVWTTWRFMFTGTKLSGGNFKG